MNRLRNLITYNFIITEDTKNHRICYLTEKFFHICMKEKNIRKDYKFTDEDNLIISQYEELWKVKLNYNEKLVFLYSDKIKNRNILDTLSWYIYYFLDYSLIKTCEHIGIHAIVRESINLLMDAIKEEPRFKRLRVEIRKSKLKSF